MNTIKLPAGIEYVQCDALPELIAHALNPDDGTNDEHWSMSFEICRAEHEQALKQALKNGILPVKNPWSRLPLTFLDGQAWKRGAITIDDVRTYAKDFGISVVVGYAPEQADTASKADSREPPPVVALPVGQPRPVVTSPEFMKKRAVLIKEHLQEWVSIENDLSEASDNGLSKAAKVAGQHGMWFVERARAWAKERGKLSDPKTPATQRNSVFDIPGTKYSA